MEYTSEYPAHLEEFVQVIRQLTEVTDTLTQIEQQKAQAAAADKPFLLNAYLNPEQAEILKLRGLEQKRMKLAALLGWKELTFHQIMEQADQGQRELLSPLFTELNTGIRRLTSAMTSSGRAIGIRLEELGTAIALTPGTSFEDGAGHFKDKYV